LSQELFTVVEWKSVDESKLALMVRNPVAQQKKAKDFLVRCSIATPQHASISGNFH
jgi:hypothetical protein